MDDGKALSLGATIVAWFFMPEAMVVITIVRYIRRKRND